ncbi:MAG: FecR domain-containing protein [Alphaproteobacteria bacterium]
MAIAPVTSANAGEWTLVRASGDVRVNMDGKNWHKISTKANLNAGDSLWTGRDGRALIRNPHSTIIIAPNSMVRVPTRPQRANRSILFHYLGEITAKVQKRRKDHFAVQTPYLAAIVKGTEFTVAVGKKTTEVSVISGRVDVRDLDTGEIVRLGPGGRAQTQNVPGAGVVANQEYDSAAAGPGGTGGGGSASTHGGGGPGGGSPGGSESSNDGTSGSRSDDQGNRSRSDDQGNQSKPWRNNVGGDSGGSGGGGDDDDDDDRNGPAWGRDGWDDWDGPDRGRGGPGSGGGGSNS